MQKTIKVSFRDALKRHGLSMRKKQLEVAMCCLERAAEAQGGEAVVSDLADKLVEVIEDEGVMSCVVEEATVLAAVKRFGIGSTQGEGAADRDARGRMDTDQAVHLEPREEETSAEAYPQQGAAAKKGTFVVLDAFNKLRSSERAKVGMSSSDASGSFPRGLGGGKDGAPREASEEDACSAVQPVSWDEVHGKFVRKSRSRCMLPPANSKVGMFRERYFLLRRRIQRNKNFLKPALEHVTSMGGAGDTRTTHGGSLGQGNSWFELAEISALLGCIGEQKFILGLISTVDHEDGNVSVEDLSGTVEVDLSQCEFASKGFYTENMVVLIEGHMQSNLVFKANAVCFPPLEEVENRGEAAMVEAGEEKFVFVSDVHLDKPECLSQFSKLLSSMESSEPVPSLIVLMGPFLSKDASAKASSAFSNDAGQKLRTHLKDLMSLVKTKHEAVAQSSTFLFVPGPGDPTPLPQTLLPQPALLNCLTENLEEDKDFKCIFASNPCRIRHKTGQELVVFRDNLQKKLKRHDLSSLILSNKKDEEDNGGPQAMQDDGAPDQENGASDFEKACSTVLHQSHLAPLPSFSHPVVWDYDQALWMTRQPDIMVLSDDSPQKVASVGACNCLNSGSFSSGSHFAVYTPSDKEIVPCRVQS
ncbi:subunit 2 of DNA polymerase epsilon [Chloropicon primus]|uniref:DNA polymerase II subunit 2 n=1 Tax=Chloropicon primus TaxID=1764295 RepID=A0A5B8N101_9CHLO|nr:subunit 2 of DNA polymerase epsilon [Chloropicon primus]|eukprot:QDZ25500.1 subunit 2 of DNA polymerase epsilon [Chloropicon primus]